jgi:hypothetical protein
VLPAIEWTLLFYIPYILGDASIEGSNNPQKMPIDILMYICFSVLLCRNTMDSLVSISLYEKLSVQFLGLIVMSH